LFFIIKNLYYAIPVVKKTVKPSIDTSKIPNALNYLKKKRNIDDYDQFEDEDLDDKIENKSKFYILMIIHINFFVFRIS
jgi:hypothetical protein